MDQIQIDHLGQVRSPKIRGERYVNLGELVMWLELRAYREIDPDAQHAVRIIASLLSWIAMKDRRD